MKRALPTALLGSVLAVALTVPAYAFDNDAAAIALHISPVVTKNVCEVPVGLTNATVVVGQPTLSTANGPFYFTYLLVCNGSDSTGIAGMEMGIDYQGAIAPEGGAFPISIFAWHNCGDIEWNLGDWPAPGTGNMITWDRVNNCQDVLTQPDVKHTVIAVGGYFYMGAYGPATMSVIPRPVSGRAKVADCRPNPAETDITDMVPSHLGVAGFGAMYSQGYNPCGAPTPVENTTWSGVKSLFKK